MAEEPSAIDRAQVSLDGAAPDAAAVEREPVSQDADAAAAAPAAVAVDANGRRRGGGSAAASPSSGHIPHLNLFGSMLPTDTTETVLKFIVQYCQQEHVEFEGKLGVIYTSAADGAAGDGKKRLFLGVCGTTPLRPASHDTMFQSGIQASQFQRINRDMNAWFAAARHQVGLTYSHTTELDHFFAHKVRVSVDPKTGRPIRQVQKSRLGLLDLHVPTSQYDIRLTANRESPCELPTGPCLMVRRKDRISYRFAIWSLDITEVHTSTKAVDNRIDLTSADLTYELELEIHQQAAVGELVRAHNMPVLYEISRAWLNNMYMCSRMCDPKYLVASRRAPPPPHSSSAAAAASNGAPPEKRPRSNGP